MAFAMEETWMRVITSALLLTGFAVVPSIRTCEPASDAGSTGV